MSIKQYILVSILTLLTMIYFHIKDDFNQGEFLSTYKQRANWLKHEIGKLDLYKNDYKACLLIHSFKWSFTIMIPEFVYMLLMDTNGIVIDLTGITCSILIWIFGNTWCHYMVDGMKANKLKINLITDQLLHLLQIVVTWLAISAMYLGRVIEWERGFYG